MSILSAIALPAGSAAFGAAAIDVLTVGREATLYRPVQRALRPLAWSLAHAADLEAAKEYLAARRAVVAVVEAAGSGWQRAVSGLRGLPGAPQVVVAAWDDVSLVEALQAGAFDMLPRPFSHADLLWAVASAWHEGMTRRERGKGAAVCSDA